MENFIKSKIRKIADNNFEFEACGFVLYSEEKQQELVLEVKNISRNPSNSFEISPLDYLNALKLGRILYIFHTHPAHMTDERSLLFTEEDKNLSTEMAIPMLLYSVSTGRFNIYTADTCVMAPLEERPFVWGTWDCFTFARDFWVQNYEYCLEPRYNFLQLEDFTELKDKDYFERGIDKLGDEIIRKYSWKDISEGDILFFRIKSKFIDHMAVYIGNNKIAHHAYNKLSAVIDLDNRWIDKFVMGISYNGD